MLSLALTVLAGCATLQEMANFAKCKFKYTNVTNTQVAGINVQQIKSFNDLGLMDAAKLTGALVQGTLPINFTMNLQVSNPNPTTAATLSKMKWVAFIDEKVLTNGVLQEKLTVASQGTANLPLTIQGDLLKVFAKKDAASKAFGLTDLNGVPQRIGLKIRPTINIGGFDWEYPGYITLSQTLKAE